MQTSSFMVLVKLVVCMSSCLAHGVGEVGCLHVLSCNFMVLVNLVVCMSSCRRLADVTGEVGCLHVLMQTSR